MKLPKVKIDSIKLIENEYQDQRGNVWNVLKLIEHSKQFKPFNMPLAGIDLSRMPWEIDNINTFVYHVKRVEKTEMIHPIILDDEGIIADGWHRVAKAILKGKTYIKAIRLESMPNPDKTEKTNERQSQ